MQGGSVLLQAIECSNNYKMCQIVDVIEEELEKADIKYKDDPMSRRELKKSFKTIESELVELERETERVDKDTTKMIKEAVQVAAMAIKFIRDVCLSTEEWNGAYKQEDNDTEEVRPA